MELTELALPGLGIALDFEASPSILPVPDAFAHATSFMVRGKESRITLTISDDGAMRAAAREAYLRADAMGITAMPAPARGEVTPEVTREAASKETSTSVTRSNDPPPRWFLRARRKLGNKTYGCDATLSSEAELAAALAACDSIRVARKAHPMRIGE